MVINDRYRFVFVHIPKTGGTSIQEALIQIPGRSDLAAKHTKHETPSELNLRIGRQRAGEISDYFFFCFVRNPWDRFLSLFRFLHKLGRHPVPENFEDFVRLLEARTPWLLNLHSIRPQSDFVSVDNQAVGRFENLESDFQRFAILIGAEGQLQHLNSSGGRTEYASWYTKRTAAVIAEYYRQDIKRFSYSY